MKLENNQIEDAVKLLERGQALHPDKVPPVFPKRLDNFFRLHLVDPKTIILVNKDVTAIIILMVVHDAFSYTQSIKDLVWYSESAGEGVKLLKEARKWVEDWGGSIHTAYLSTSLNDKRAEMLIENMGLERIGTVYKFKGEEACQ